MHKPFSFAYYEHLLQEAHRHGYEVTSFERYEHSRPRVLLMRHDVDYTLDGVLELAEIEHRLGCHATYLMRVHADDYNVFSCTAYALMQRLLQLGHEIGLHFEAMNVGRALNLDPPELLRREKLILETVLGRPMLTCSEHREISGLVHETPLFHEIHDAYEAGFRYYAMDPKYCKTIKYLSDSNAHWREGDPLQHYGKHDHLQVLIHADWWFEDDLLLKGPYVHPRGLRD